MSIFRSKWLAKGLTIDEPNKDLAETTITEMYSLVGIDKPVYIWLDSPLSCNLVINIFKDQLGDQLGDQLRDQLRDQLGDQLWDQLGDQLRDQLGDQLRDQLRDQLWDQLRDQLRDQLWDQLEYHPTNMWGSIDAYWVTWYLFAREIGVVYKKENNTLLNKWISLIDSNIGFWYPFDGICLISRTPELIKFNGDKVLHSEDGPAIRFKDGFEVYSWGGVRIPGDWIKGDLPTPQEALVWDNVEQRRCLCEIIGWDKILNTLDAVTIDKDPDPQIGELIECDIPDSGKERFLKVKCGTGRDNIFIPVAPTTNTALEANASTWGSSGIDPEIIKNLEIRT